MALKIAINGFGRIGRPFFRLVFDDPDFKIVAINDLLDVKTCAHLLKYDSTFGKYNREVFYDSENLIVAGERIKLYSLTDPAKLPWKELDVDIVLESTGRFRSLEEATIHITAGAKRVVVSAPAKGEMATFVYGVNHKDYDPAVHTVISNASCTTNALAPVAMIMEQEFGIVSAMMSTVHAYTNDQSILDKAHKDLRRARSAGVSIIPTTTGAAKAVALVLPQLKGKMNGFAMRVPVQDASIVDLNLLLSCNVSEEIVNNVLKCASENQLKGIIGYSEEPLVSVDYIGDSHSGVIDALSTMVVNKNFVKIVIWYDNEYGYSNRLKDLMKYMGERF